MDELLTREKELMKLNAEIDHKTSTPVHEGQKKKKPTLKTRLPKPTATTKTPRPGSKGLAKEQPEVHFSEDCQKNEESDSSFVWAPLPMNSTLQNGYIWAPIDAQDEVNSLNSCILQNTNGVSQPPPPAQHPTSTKSHKTNKKDKHKESAASKVVATIPEDKQMEDEATAADARAYSESINGDDYGDKVLISRTDQTQIKILSLKLKSFETQLEKMREEYGELYQSRETLEKENRNLDEQRRRLESTNRGLMNQIDKTKVEIADMKLRVQTTEEENMILKKELDEAKKENKKNLSKKSSSDVRLNRALEEANKLRGELNAAEREKKEAKEGGKKAVDELTNKNKFLEKQRNELLQGFKKQMELIDVLKRQKLHLEAAHVLRYTEEEFMQTLDWKPGQPRKSSYIHNRINHNHSFFSDWVLSLSIFQTRPKLC